MERKNGIISSFFKKFLFIPSLALALLSVLAFITLYDQGAIDNLFAIKNNYISAIILSVFTLIILSIFLVQNLSVKKLNMTDILPISLVLFAIGIFLYFFLGNIKFSIKLLLIYAIPFLYGVIFIFIRSITFDTKENKKNLSKFSLYYKNLFLKFNPILILLFALVFSCFIWQLLIYNKTINFDDTKKIMLSIVGIFVLLFLFFNSGDKKINVLDSFLFSELISLPVAFVIIFFFNTDESSKTLYLIIFCAILLLSLIFLLIRHICFDEKLNDEKIINALNLDNYNNFSKTKKYFIKLNNNFNILQPIIVGIVLAVFGQILFSESLWKYLLVINLIDGFSGGLVPFDLINGIIQISIFVISILSLININSKKITSGDFLTFVLLSYSAFAIPSMICFQFITATALACVYFALSITLISARINKLN